jgi:hypothetical protein
MKIPYAYRPGAGFLFFVAVTVAAMGFASWGLAVPPLERVWQMDIELRSGARGPLDASERALLQDVILRHPEVADFLVEDKHAGIFSDNDNGQIDQRYAYLIRRSPRPRTLEIAYRGTDPDGSVKVKLRAGPTRLKGKTSAQQPLRWRLSDEGPFPQLVELRFKRKGRHTVRVDLVDAP